MRKIATLDCETNPAEYGAELIPFIWCLYDGEEYYLFDDAKGVAEFLADKEWIVYAHNGGKFDYHFMLELLEPFSKIMNINGRLAKFKIGLCEFRDSVNILPIRLADYQKDNFDYDKLRPENRDKHIHEIISYIKNDCLFLYQIVSHFVENYGMNLTLAGAAMKTYFKVFREEKPEKTSPDFYDEFKDFYYGGRVECFKKGIIKKPFFVIDVNSAYPHAMLHDHPYSKKFTYSRFLPEKNIEQSFITLECIADGCFPFRTDDKKLIFPNDGLKRRYFVSGWEYIAALEYNAIKDVRIINSYSFDNFINFQNYVSYFYEMKNKNVKGTPDYIIAKLFLNSLYGKFAADPSKYKETYICPPENIDAACEELELEHVGELGPWAILEGDCNPFTQTYYNVATAASITGFQRAYLFKAMRKCEGVLYCDTDSIACEKFDLKIGKKLGEWDIEGEFESGGIGGKKLYAFKYKEKDKYKTASKGAKLQPLEILKICSGEKVLYKSNFPSYSMKRGKFYLERTIKMT